MNLVGNKSETVPTDIDQPQMKPAESESRYRTILQKFWVIEVKFMKQMLRLIVYLAIATLIFSMFYKNNKIRMEEQNYFSDEQVVYTSEIRGLFPPIEGSDIGIIGKWVISFTNTLQMGMKTDSFSDYILEFKSNSNLRVRKKDCQGDLIMNWATYSFNIYISEYEYEYPDQQMIIQPDPKDLQCITENTQFFENLKSASIWSIYGGRLYILIEKWNKQTHGNVQMIIILQRAK